MINRYEIIDSCRDNLNKYLLHIFSQIPVKPQARLVDIGCGTGVSVCTIAAHYDYSMIAVDYNRDALRVLKKKIGMLGSCGQKISVQQGRIEEAGLSENSFYIVVAEGYFNMVGFEAGLKVCSALMQDGGYLVLHDELKDKEQKLALFENNHFSLVESLEIDEQVWWDAYFGCIEKKISNFSQDGAAVMKNEMLQIEAFKKDPSAFCSIYYLLKKE